jgi:hypothetical protein
VRGLTPTEPRSPRVLDNSLSRHRTHDGPCLLQDGHGPSGRPRGPSASARRSRALRRGAGQQGQLIRCFNALLSPLGYNFPTDGILTDASKLSAVHDLISSYWSNSSEWQAFKATEAYCRAAPAFNRFATLGGRFLPPLVPVGLEGGQGSSSDPTFSELMSAFFKLRPPPLPLHYPLPFPPVPRRWLPPPGAPAPPRRCGAGGSPLRRCGVGG